MYIQRISVCIRLYKHAEQISSLIGHDDIKQGEGGCVHAYRGERLKSRKETNRHGSYKHLVAAMAKMRLEKKTKTEVRGHTFGWKSVSVGEENAGEGEQVAPGSASVGRDSVK